MELNSIPNVSDPNPTPDAEALATPDNTQEALQAIAKEHGVKLDDKGNVTEEVKSQPEVPPKAEEQATPDPVAPDPAEKTEPEAVPAKFQKEDGTLDEEKLKKSTQSLKDQLEKLSPAEQVAEYSRLEKEYQKAQNEVHNPKVAPQLTDSSVKQQASQLTPLELDVANVIFSEAKAQGSPVTEGQAIAIAKSQVKLQQATLEAGTAETDARLSKVEGNEKTRQLQGLVDEYPELLTKGMPAKLDAILKAKPYLRKAPEPYKEAFFSMLGEAGRGEQVKTPNPKGKTAPAVPVNPVSRVTPDAGVTSDSSIEALEAQVRKENPGYKGL